MTVIPTRRRVLGGIALAVPAAALPLRRAAALEPPLETTTIRLPKQPIICFAPQYVCEQLLRAEGFTEIRYVEMPIPATIAELAGGRVDLGSDLSIDAIKKIDSGVPLTIVSGVHGGCLELFAHGDIRTIADLKGKTVAEAGGVPALLPMMAAWVGLDPKSDFTNISDPAQPTRGMELFAAGKIDAYLAFPPEVQELRGRKIGHVILRTAVDRPWSQYFCCALVGNQEFVARHPVATKRAIRAFLKAAELCASAPERAARLLVDGGITPRYDYALQMINDVPYDLWHDYDPDDTIRFYALRLHELGMIKTNPNKIIAEGTNWRFFNELRRELKA